MTTTPPADLAALIGSRICHDLVNPLGAIGNGVELLEMVQEPSPELALLAQSTAQAQATLRLFRLAFGAARADQHIPGRDMPALLNAALPAAPPRIETALPESLPRSDARLIALLMLCCQSALPWGGQVTLAGAEDGARNGTRNGAGGVNWQITARAGRMRIDAALWRSLSDPAAPLPGLTPAQVHFALVPPALTASDRYLDLALAETAIDLSF